MSTANDKILLVEPDPRILETLVDAFVHRFHSNITCVSSAADALDVEMLEPHSIAIIDTAIEDSSAVSLAVRLRELGDRPIVIIGNEPTTAEALDAMRCGVADYFIKPFQLEDLLDMMERAIADYRELRSQRHRFERMRALVRRVLKDRRSLNRRVDLICKDLVGAHKRLARRVVESQSRNTTADAVEA